LTLLELSGLSRQIFHTVGGLVIFYLAVKIFKIDLSSPRALVAPFVFGIFLEILDWRDAYVFGGPISFLDTVGDILLTVALPIIFLVFFRFKEYKQKEPSQK